ncbi:PREDICTED: uncharacterized protein LOC107104926 [Cyprinodon variegatus]|uniref:uncharacterized protein LOC107104926 n=1 Tax=Cyprinodon variegatus TaxID=28743 RepID=UPI0007428E39|nr:PREDICTED: uncharacterized protein LOC107104926 [Cyprinodon variegatus]
MNTCPMGDNFEVGDAEDEIDKQLTEVHNLNTKVLQNIEMAQERQQRTFGDRKRKFTRVATVEAGDECLISGASKRPRTGDTLTSQHRGPYKIGNITKKGVATVLKGSTTMKVNVSRLRPYYRLTNEQLSEGQLLNDHEYSSRDWQQEHSYCFSGAKWERDVNPVQEALLCYILDQDCSPAELIVKEGSVCLTREDFWSLGLSQCMESNAYQTFCSFGEPSQWLGSDFEFPRLIVYAFEGS